MTATIAAVRRALLAAERPLISSHQRLDGDAVGSALALADVLRALGKRPHVVNDSDVPRVYRFLPGADDVGSSPEALRDDYDLAVVLDASSWPRLGRIRERLPAQLPSLFIDHHPPEQPNGDVNWIDVSSSSTGEMIYHLAAESDWPISPAAATALHVAVVTDTGRFCFANTTPASLHAAARLVELGADPAAIARHLYYSETLDRMRLRGEVQASAHTCAGGRIAIAHLTLAMMQAHGIDPIDTQDFADIPRGVSGVEVGCLLREIDSGRTKASLRAGGEVDVRAVAQAFGGGGHSRAAGCEIEAPLTRAEQLVVAEIERRLA